MTISMMSRSENAQQFHVRVWRGRWWNSLEHFSLEHKLASHVLEGFIVGLMEKKPFNLHYKINCDSKWQTRQAEIATTRGQEKNSSASSSIRKTDGCGMITS